MEIEKLYKKYIEASNLYYNTGESSMTDEEFDELESYLLENGTDSMKEQIRKSIMTASGELSEASGLMISLKKIKFKDNSTISEILKFFGNKQSFVYAPKYDGCAIKITQDNGVKIHTRGGMDVTNKLLKNKHILQLIENKELPDVCCGELIIRKKVFNEKYADEYENARNFVSGFLSKKENTNIDVNDFLFIPCTDGTNTIKQPYIIDGYIQGWKDIDRRNLYSIKEMINFYKSDDFPFMCDGIVLAVFTEKRIIKDNYPLNMVAIKFPATNATSTVIGVEWTQKKSGKLTPVLLIEPTKLEGSTVTRVSGMNYSYLKTNHAGIGAEIQFSKSGDIIPIMNKVIKRSDEMLFPQVEYYVDGKNLYAVDSQKSTEYKFYCGLKHLNIEGIGPENANIIGDVCEYDIIKMFDKKLKPDFIQKLGIDSALWNKFSSIYDVKTLYLDDLIFMLQFDGVGAVNAKKVADLITKKIVDTKNIPNKVLNNVCRGEGFAKIKESLTKLSEYGVKVIKRSENTQSLTFEMSGEPPKMTKKDFVDIMKQMYPNSQHTTLCKDTNYLIVDDSNSNTGKANKARKYQIKIVTYKDVLNKKVIL